MELARLILDYLQVLIWPALLLVLLWKYRDTLDVLADRLKEADEVGAWGLTWKVRHQLAELSASLPAEARNQLNKQVAGIALDELRVLARDLETKPLAERRRAAQAVKQLAPEIPLEIVPDLTESPFSGERAAAAIVLSYHLRADQSAYKHPKLRGMLKRGLQDPDSRVRYRYAELLQRHPSLAGEFKGMLEEITKSERNRAVFKAARQALQSAS